MENILIKACDELQINITKEQIQKFLKYKDILIHWNQKINLTSITEPEEIFLKHFLDCIIPVKFRNFYEKDVIDVGTGAGFPGVVLKIMEPSINLTLLDTLNKRINFLQNLANELNLQSINFLHSRAEISGKDALYREKFDYCCSRAVANLTVLCEYTLPFVKIGGELVALKGPKVFEELELAKNAIHELGAQLVNIQEIKIPFTDITHNIIFIKKVRHTPEKYPRKQNKISKSPIN